MTAVCLDSIKSVIAPCRSTLRAARFSATEQYRHRVLFSFIKRHILSLSRFKTQASNEVKDLGQSISTSDAMQVAMLMLANIFKIPCLATAIVFWK